MDPQHQHRPWEDLPAGLLADIARRLPCLADSVPMANVCRRWREAAHPAPRQAPLLLLPYRTATPPPPGGTARSTAAFFCVLTGDTHSLRVRHDTGGARFFGAFDGGWLFLAHAQTRHHALVNLHTYRRIPLPDSVLWVGGRVRDPCAMVILAATLSCPPPPPPPTPPTEQCMAAAIIASGYSPHFTRLPEFAFWRVEEGGQVQVASGFMWMRRNVPAPASFALTDVIHHRGAFHFLTDADDVIVCTAEYREEEGLVVHPEYRFFLPAGEPQNQDLHVTARYLVESRGELLMVVKCTNPYPGWPTTCRGWPTSTTWTFMVFQKTPGQEAPDGVVEHTWAELPALDGRMLFVARGCSRSYEVADFPGFQEGVYFLDDKNSDDVTMMFQTHLHRKYACNDNGVWSGPPPRRWFPRQDPSDYSSPVWFLP